MTTITPLPFPAIDLIARFDAFASEFLAICFPDDLREMIASELPHANDSIDSAIVSIIDAQFDDNFAIITDDDDNAYSIFLEFIESNRRDFTIFLFARISAFIAR